MVSLDTFRTMGWGGYLVSMWGWAEGKATQDGLLKDTQQGQHGTFLVGDKEMPSLGGFYGLGSHGRGTLQPRQGKDLVNFHSSTTCQPKTLPFGTKWRVNVML